MFCDSDGFLNELHKLFERKKKSGTVWITMKRSNLKPRPSSKPQKPKKQKKKGSAAAAAATAATPPRQEPGEFQCLIRATDGKRKISTALSSSSELMKFQTSYALILRAHMDSLKKREKTKTKKDK